MTSAMYPVILLPDKITHALSVTPELARYPILPPKAEDFPPDISAGKSLVATLYGAFGLRKQSDELTAPERLTARQRYETARQAYNRAQATFDAAEAAKFTPEALQSHRRRMVAPYLEASASDRPGESAALVGPAEAHLYSRLAHHFPGLILRRRMLRVGADAYHPDYLLFDPAHKLRIDIELDEPYTLRVGMPIHFLEGEESIDAPRDQAFLAAGWAVVRFSEEQAVNDPDGCARVIADVREKLTGKVTPSLCAVQPVTPAPRWSREDANRMAAAGTRSVLLKTVTTQEPMPAPKAARRVFSPSQNQRRIFEFLAHGQGHGLVIAVAGSGKSTTLLEAVKVVQAKQPSARIVLLAFNKSISNELSEKLREDGIRGVETATLNGFGLQLLAADRGKDNIKIIRNKERGMLNRAARDLGMFLSDADMRKAADLYSKFQSYVYLDPGSQGDFERLATQYSVNAAAHLQPVVARALELAVGLYVSSGQCTLDEQNYLPVKLKLPIRPYDFVFVDECQDLTQTQLEMVVRAAGAKGRLLFVGDPGQAIMGFRGADNQSVQNILNLQPTELPLTVSYRCPTLHINLAKKLMPSLEAAPGAKPGDILELSWDEAFEHVQEGDLLFARTRKLVDWVVLELLARGMTLNYTVETEDDDEGGNTSARAMHVAKALREAAMTYKGMAVPARRPAVSKKDKPLEKLLPWALGQIHQQAQAWDGEFTEYVELLTRPDERLGVRVSSAHQAKGLEARRVFVMGESAFEKSKSDQQAWVEDQERNLKYVALTRAKETLHLVKEPEYRS